MRFVLFALILGGLTGCVRQEPFELERYRPAIVRTLNAPQR